MDEILDVVIPSILINTPNYYVKGGKCFDFFFKNKSGSKDWDLVQKQ